VLECGGVRGELRQEGAAVLGVDVEERDEFSKFVNSR
jgi:hypothetical protein